ncbi:MAG: hypothetical protein OXE84_01195 [Rhodobacteraceae bacterium]|nr:hypothetical protein [Paracoccaceae bacterium]
MPNPDAKTLHPHVPFLYEMTVSFFDMAKENLEQFLHAIDGYKELEVDLQGQPESPNHVAAKIKNLPPEMMTTHVGACLSATTNLGLAYVHAFRLLGFLACNRDPLPVNTVTPNLVELFDALPPATQQALCALEGKVKAHDIEMEIAPGQFPEEREDTAPEKSQGLRGTLAYWQSRGLLHDSHRSLFGTDSHSILRLFIPYRSILVLDGILAEQIAPQGGATYETVDQRMARYDKGPVLKWDEGRIQVELPKRLGRTLEARWQPTVTSVVRIRKKGTSVWSLGFETVLNRCGFVDLEPGTDYEIKLTHKNDAGEGESVIRSMTTLTE